LALAEVAQPALEQSEEGEIVGDHEPQDGAGALTTVEDPAENAGAGPLG
jgi:hypothetical protein